MPCALRLFLTRCFPRSSSRHGCHSLFFFGFNKRSACVLCHTTCDGLRKVKLFSSCHRRTAARTREMPASHAHTGARALHENRSPRAHRFGSRRVSLLFLSLCIDLSLRSSLSALHLTSHRLSSLVPFPLFPSAPTFSLSTSHTVQTHIRRAPTRTILLPQVGVSRAAILRLPRWRRGGNLQGRRVVRQLRDEGAEHAGQPLG